MTRPNEGARSLSQVDARDALERLRRDALGVDVRSPKEFSRGALPQFLNLPILDDNARHEVGLTYKQKGQSEAVRLGHELVTPVRETITRAWVNALSSRPPEGRLVTCWRGGLRSQLACEWLDESGLECQRVRGGYKAMRAQLLEALRDLPELMVLGGLTGTGKTDLLRELGGLDLEELACHRGSAFGLRPGDRQPSQQTFENALLWRLTGPLMLLEDEGRMIGRLALPSELYEAMKAAPVVWLESRLEDRVARVFAEYVQRAGPVPTVHAHLRLGVQRLARKLGGLRTREILSDLDRAFERGIERGDHQPWIECLLRGYYDPQYEFALKRRNIVFRGDVDAVQNFLSSCLGRRRS